ncbi:MarR family transcriptional regulator [Streptomyces sp. NPDC050804]|uniref:MarR family winged helix-turn-helix transcriptional regulator n=1 Tax=unclassified Streptomyces TaxID=2593676 RepID=UPI003415CC02|nr:MarR family transcriptional regulator [Streptomyces sp. NBC_00872]
MPRKTSRPRSEELVALFTELGPAWGAWINACTPAGSVSYVRMRLLNALHTDGAQTMTQLAQALGVTQRRITALVDALDEDGLVERRPNPADGRSTVVSLTRGGTALQKLAWDEYRTDISRAFDDLSPEQQEQLIEITPVLTEALRRHTASRPTPQ